IMERLSDRPLSASQLALPLKITLTAVIQHLQILEECGLVRTEKIGRMRTCRIDSRGLNALEQWIRDLRAHWEERLDRLGDLLNEEKES
ncbi:MAG TPA: ArsR family transcriptional regulator, partial [Blastocatellia bacterium]